MSHCDQDTLSLLALGESASPADASHLASCQQCQDELASLRSVVQTARSELSGILIHEADGTDVTEGTPVTRIPPPPRVWERIAAATGVTTAPRPEAVIAASGQRGPAAPGSHPLVSRNGSAPVSAELLTAHATPPGAAPAAVPGPEPAQAAGPAPAADVTGAVSLMSPGPAPDGVAASPVAAPSSPPTPVPLPGPVTTVTPHPPAVAPDTGVDPPRPAPRVRAGNGRRLPRQSRDRGSLIGIGIVALIIGLLGGYGASTWVQDRPQQVASPAVVAGTPLRGLPLAPAAAGDASVIQTSSGRQLDVDVRRLDPTSGHYYEVWLISPDISRMVSVGVLQGQRGQFTLPPGVDLSQFPLVDISIQTYDGTGAHSGRSVLRGTLNV